MAHKTPHAPMRAPSRAARPAAGAQVPHEVVHPVRTRQTAPSSPDGSSSSVVPSVTGDELPVADVVTASLVVASAAATVVCDLLSPSCGHMAFFRTSTRVQRSFCTSAKATAADACAFLALPAGADVPMPSRQLARGAPHTARKPVVAISTFRREPTTTATLSQRARPVTMSCCNTITMLHHDAITTVCKPPQCHDAVSTLHRIPPQHQLNTAHRSRLNASRE
ncbi:hypothetical protein EDB85DRAFT_2141448 [Lactarius pseudohatsudake]|nr:hypothetical protein EDB85DRAFT_2141448 [Lactarius pseudohatsudake]